MRYVREIEWQAARIATCPSMPPVALLDGLDAHLSDMGSKGTLLCRVEDLPDHDGPVWYMVMTDPSTGREYGNSCHLTSVRTDLRTSPRLREDHLRMTLEG